MKNRTLTLASLALALSTVNSPLAAFGQGSLTPPGPPTPMMKTLAQIEPRTPISSLPLTITNAGSYYLTTNLTATGSGNGIMISSSNVIVDLNGFTLQGGPGSGNGIYVTASYYNLVVRNGTVTGWGGNGVDSFSAAYPRNMLFESLAVYTNSGAGIKTEADSIVRNCLALFNGGDGIFSAGGEIVGCISRSNNGNGIAGYSCTVRECRSEYNNVTGIYLSRSRALDCEMEYTANGEGVYIDNIGNEVRRCRIVSNADSGIYCAAGSKGSVIADCLIANNQSSGIQLHGAGNSLVTGNNVVSNFGAGINISDTNNRVENNTVQTSNGTFGIVINGFGYTNNVIVRNTVCGGGSSTVNYYDPGNNDFGPIGTAGSSSSPWANISH